MPYKDPEKAKERNRLYYHRTKTKFIKRQRNWYLQTNFNLTLDQYNILLESQNYKCKICEVLASQIKVKLSVDHCHKTQRIRGLLCQKCNLGLGLFQDSSLLLKKASEYLNEKS